MPLARIRTQFPEEVGDLCEVLIEAGYVVETVRPDEFRIVPADLEFLIDKLPAVEAWRNIPDSDVVYVAPGTPESRDVRSSAGRSISRAPLLPRLVTNFGETTRDASQWCARHWRELRARVHDLRARLTPPREYHSSPHLEPIAGEASAPVDLAIMNAKREQEERRRAREAAERELALHAQLEAENRRRAREADAAKALLAKQQKIDSMVRATEQLRERVLQTETQPQHMRRPRKPSRILRTRRDRAFARAGVAAFSLSLGLAVLAGEVLHPKPVSTVVPPTTSADQAPFTKTQPAAQSATFAPQPPTPIPSLAKKALLDTTVMTAQAKPSPKHDDAIADDEVEVIVRKANVARPRPKPSHEVAHYSDLN